jgi:hypothetical protein
MELAQTARQIDPEQAIISLMEALATNPANLTRFPQLGDMSDHKCLIGKDPKWKGRHYKRVQRALLPAAAWRQELRACL